jgi:cytochrome d ubiquinol oxidase subunit II
MKVDATMEYVGSFFDLLGPYPILVGLFTVSLFAMHGSIYLYLKTEGELQQRIHGWMWRTFFVFLVLFVITSVVSIVAIPSATYNFQHYPWAWAIAILNALAIANIPRAIHQHRPGYAFFSSCCSIAALVFLFGAALYPNLLVSSLDPAYNLTLYTAASSQKTLTIMAIIAAIGMPFVLSYTTVIYWVFRGKVKLGQFSY